MTKSETAPRTRNPRPAAIAEELAKLGITATGACNLTPGQWRMVERLAGASALTGRAIDEVIDALALIDCQRFERRRAVKAMGAGA